MSSPGIGSLPASAIRIAVDRGRDPAEVKPTAEAIANIPQDASREGFRVGRVGGNRHLEQRLEVLGATVHGECPDILQSEVWRRSRGYARGEIRVLCSEASCFDPRSIRYRMDVRQVACICQYGAV